MGSFLKVAGAALPKRPLNEAVTRGSTAIG